MKKRPTSIIAVKGRTVAVVSRNDADFKNPDRADDLVRNWLRNRNTIEFLGVWEYLNNPDFNSGEFDGIKMQAGLNSFLLTPRQWIDTTAVIGMVSQSGRYRETFAHKDNGFRKASNGSIANARMNRS